MVRIDRLLSGAALATAAAGRGLANTTATVTTLRLGDLAWTLSNDNGTIAVPGRVPSHAHLDLLAAGLIPEPTRDLGDMDLRWVALANWTYATRIGGVAATAAQTWLVFDGLDTFADIALCGQAVGSADNQFRQWRFDVTAAVAACRRSSSTPGADGANGTVPLVVRFASAPVVAAQIAGRPGQETWPHGVGDVFEFPHRQFVRKAQSDFGWDWGPAFAPAGLWKDAWLHQLGAAESLVVTNTAVDVYRAGQRNNVPPDQTAPWVVNASIDVLGSVPEGATLRYSLTSLSSLSSAGSDGTNGTNTSAVVAAGTLAAVNNTGDTITGVVTLPAASVRLWWPAGMGGQPLYNLTVDIVAPTGGLLASTTRRIGFRTIVVNMAPVTAAEEAGGVQGGSHWHFEINGHAFYAKGSNFVPADAFWPRVTAAQLRRLLGAAVAGNQHMLRLWASGVYGPDALYDAADELGVLLWSEFEFGDALYPADAAFLENVRREAVYQVRRTVHHPSVAVWAGGNELENLELWWVNRSAPAQLGRFVGEYEALFLDTLLPAVYGNSHGLTYMPSSTNNGYLELRDRDAARPWVPRYNNKTAGAVYGVTEWYNYQTAQAFATARLPVGRFANEFGIHAMPSLATWQEALSREADLRWDSLPVVTRTHHPAPAGILNSTAEAYRVAWPGLEQMADPMKAYYPLAMAGAAAGAVSDDAAVANFSAWCHVSQVFQADWLRHQIFYYRAGSGLPNRQRGALYWQLNDVWQAPTWATVEYGAAARWKVGHYATRDAFQAVIAAPVFDEVAGVLRVYAVSDLWTPVRGTLCLGWEAWAGGPMNVSAGAGCHAFAVAPLSATLVAAVDVAALAAAPPPGYDARDGLLVMNLTAAGVPIAALTAALEANGANDANANAAAAADLPTATYTHTALFTPTPLAAARLAADAGLEVLFEAASDAYLDGVFVVTATAATSVWTWLAVAPEDAPDLAVVFDDNGFLLKKGETRRIGFRVDWRRFAWPGWQDRVTVESITK